MSHPPPIQPPRRSIITARELGIVAAIVGIPLAFLCILSAAVAPFGPDDKPVRKPQPKMTIEKAAREAYAADSQLQADRHEAIEKMIAARIIHKIATPGSVARVHVLPAFHGLTFDDKESFMGIVFAHAYELPRGATGEPGQFIRIMDAQTGKEIGQYTSRGLSLD